MRATRLLESQHRQAESLLGQLRSRTADRKRILNELADVLAAHMLIEEEILYPAASTVRGPSILQNYEEHEVEVPVVARLLATGDDDAFDARLAVLTELFQQHVAREENDLFPEMDRVLGQQQNQIIGEQMEKRFHQVFPMGHQAIMTLRPLQVGVPGAQCPSQQGGLQKQADEREEGGEREAGDQEQAGQQDQSGQQEQGGRQGEPGQTGRQEQAGQQGGSQGQPGQAGEPDQGGRQGQPGQGRRPGQQEPGGRRGQPGPKAPQAQPSGGSGGQTGQTGRSAGQQSRKGRPGRGG